MMETLALVMSSSFDESPKLTTRGELPPSVSDDDLEGMRGELEGGISVGGIRIMVTLRDLGKDRKVTSLNSMSAGGHSFGGTLLSYTQLPESFFEAPGSSRHLEDTIVEEFTASKRLALMRQLWAGLPWLHDRHQFQMQWANYFPTRMSHFGSEGS